MNSEPYIPKVAPGLEELRLLVVFSCLVVGCAERTEVEQSLERAIVPGATETPATEEVVRVDSLGVPVRPELEGWPAVFEDALDAAYAGVGEDGSGFDGISELAILFHANGFLEEAAICYGLLKESEELELAVEREPAAVARWFYLQALLRLDLGDLPAGLDLLEQTVSKAPHYLPAWLNLGNLRFKSGQSEPAVDAYRRCLELEPENPQAKLGLVQEYLRRGEDGKAKTLLRQLLRETPEFGQGQKLLAQLLDREGDVEGSEIARTLGENHGQYPDPRDPWVKEMMERCYDVHQLIVLADANVVVGRFKAAFDLFARAEAVAPHSPKVPLIRGLRLVELGDLPAAEDSLRKAIRLGGDTTTAYAALVGVYRKQDDSATALETAKRGLKENPGSARLNTAMGVIMLTAGKPLEAESFLREALRKDPYKVNAIRPLTQVLWEQGKEQEALARMREVRRLAPSDFQSRSFLTSYYCERGEFAEAEPFLREALDLKPDDPELNRIRLQFLHAYGDQLMENGRHADAIRYYREGIERNPNLLVLYRNMALAFANIENWDAAIENMTQYIEERPEDLGSWVALGDMHWSAGKFEYARKRWRTAKMLARGTGNPPDLLKELNERLGRAIPAE